MSTIVEPILIGIALFVVGAIIVAPFNEPINDSADDEAQRQVDYCGIVVVDPSRKEG